MRLVTKEEMLTAAFSLRLQQIFKTHGMHMIFDIPLLERMTDEFKSGAMVVVDMRTETPQISIIPSK